MEKIQNVYLIKDLAQLTRLSIDSIKYYCKLGLLKEDGRSLGTNFRYFSDSAVETLQKIRQLRTQRYSLKQIHAMLQAGTNTEAGPSASLRTGP